MMRTGVVIAASIFAVSLTASEYPDTGVAVSVPVTVQTQASGPARSLSADNILVSQDKQHRQIVSLAPLDRSAGVQLWILLDDGLTRSFGTQLADIRQFVLAQPASTQIGIGYISNGRVIKVQSLTADHQAAVRALRLPAGPAGIAADPYTAMKDLIRKWPSAPAREILFISTGFDPIYGPGPEDPYLDNAIQTAQRANVVVYAMFYPGMGPWGHSGRQAFWGQYDLAKITEATGGELYWIGNQAPVSLTPYFNDLARNLNGQYLLTFLATPKDKAGLQRVNIKSELPHVKLSAPSQVYVPAVQ